MQRKDMDNATEIGLFSTSGPWNAGQGIMVSAQMAVDVIINRSDILPGYKLNIKLKNAECNDGVGVKALADNVCESQTKIMIIGAGCSTVSSAVAIAAHKLNLIQEITDDTVIQYSSNSCWSNHQDKFLVSILIIEGVFLLRGVFLAWETRKIELSMLNESRYIGMCIYNVVVLGVVGVLVSYSLRNDPILVYIITSSITCLCGTVTQCLLFVPKVMTWRKFKQGKLQDDVNTNVVVSPAQ